MDVENHAVDADVDVENDKTLDKSNVYGKSVDVVDVRRGSNP